ncbi:hypothetical protein CVD28_25150 [Bacillus sp. M6-12]|uniref:bifunctional adenosylcobinamide kinase/adenosylcobinamide-phosphate guanylyltransferase n=1 Tax=Bacillus sp. M6-12 TaxID=2054166 RepID=UPI000C792EF5|nr:bifunctional adenosylcobinamide kinase/adenosylcobinamide-phosphate guanylyltransferase [Bacillus sp. M6-12]PLS15010.1 hypothetical protein CVD28_25150 [Bacillus sp. M6-12]
MHFITGGAFNGKSQWVRNYYQLNDSDCRWISAYSGDVFDYRINESGTDLIVMEGLELWIKRDCHTIEFSEWRKSWQQSLLKWKSWEQEESGRQIIFIGTDISKGIVPVDPNERKWRDLTGWAYQDLTAASDRVDLIWYGVGSQLK